MSTNYRRISLREGTSAAPAEKETPEARFWQRFRHPVTQRLSCAPSCVAFSPVAPHDFALAAGVRVSIYDYKTNAEKRALGAFKDTVHSVAYRHDGRLITSGLEKGTVVVADATNRTLLRSFRGHRGPTHTSRFACDGNIVLSGSDDAAVRVWDIAANACVGVVEHAHDDYVRASATTPTAPSLWATGGYDHVARLWDLRSMGGGGGRRQRASRRRHRHPRVGQGGG